MNIFQSEYFSCDVSFLSKEIKMQGTTILLQTVHFDTHEWALINSAPSVSICLPFLYIFTKIWITLELIDG